MPFRGPVIEIPIGSGGYNANQNISQVQIDELIDADNITFEFGTLQKEGGSSLYNPTRIFGIPIIGGHDWFPNLDTTQRSIVIGHNGVVLKDSGAGTYPTTLTVLPNPSSTTPVFVEGGREQGTNPRKLFIYTGQNQIQVLVGDGDTCAPLASPPADWATVFPVGGCIHLNRHVGFGGANPHYIYMSDQLDHTDFSTENGIFIPVYPGVGEGISAIASFKGQLIVWKYPRGIYALNTTDPLITNWQTTELSGTIGCASPLSGCPVDDDILFMDATGSIHLLSTTLEYGDYGLKSVSDLAWIRNYIQANIDQSKLSSVQSVFYLLKREAHFIMPGIGSLYNSKRLVVDFNRPDKIRFRPSTKDTLASIWLTRDNDGIPHPWGGDQTGAIWRLDQPSKDVNGVGYTSLWQTPHIDFSFADPSLGAKRKNFKFLELIVEPEGNWTLTVDVYLDGKYSQTQQFNMGASGDSLGSFPLGSGVLGSAAVVGSRRRLTGSGKRISLVGTLGGPDQDFSISKALVSFTIAGESDAH